MANLGESEPKRILCVECRREQRERERGWRAYLTTDEDEAAEVVVYCPTCATREFGAQAEDGHGL
ncbi:MAG: hypothetical protein H0U53_06115 [Actinobacteria bacterium]|nr:hypothetical protein [Actinomycetota bacterium]